MCTFYLLIEEYFIPYCGDDGNSKNITYCLTKDIAEREMKKRIKMNEEKYHFDCYRCYIEEENIITE